MSGMEFSDLLFWGLLASTVIFALLVYRHPLYGEDADGVLFRISNAMSTGDSGGIAVWYMAMRLLYLMMYSLFIFGFIVSFIALVLTLWAGIFEMIIRFASG